MSFAGLRPEHPGRPAVSPCMENDSKAGGAGVAVALLIMVAVAAGGGFTGKYLEAEEPVARLVHLGALAPDYEME